MYTFGHTCLRFDHFIRYIHSSRAWAHASERDMRWFFDFQLIHFAFYSRCVMFFLLLLYSLHSIFFFCFFFFFLFVNLLFVRSLNVYIYRVPPLCQSQVSSHLHTHTHTIHLQTTLTHIFIVCVHITMPLYTSQSMIIYFVIHSTKRPSNNNAYKHTHAHRHSCARVYYYS